MAATEVKGLLAKLRAAADGIKAQIHEADAQIVTLTTERATLTDAPVSREDFMDYVRDDIQRRAASYPNSIARWKRKTFVNNFAGFERTHGGGRNQAFPYLHGEDPHDGNIIETAALYWYFGDLIAERFGAALDAIAWPDESVSVAARRIRIAEIDARLDEITARRDELAAELVSTGMHE